MSRIRLRLMTAFLLSMTILASCGKDEEPKLVVEPNNPTLSVKTDGKLADLSGKAEQSSLEEILKSYIGKTIEELNISGHKLEQKDLTFIKKSFKSIEKLDLSGATLSLGSTEDGFKGSKNIKRLVLPQKLEQVGFGQLAYTTIEELIFSGNKLKSIGSGAFSLSNQLKTVKLPESVEILDGEAFSAMAGLERIELPKEISVIPSRCFSFDPKLKEVVFKGTIRHLGANAFTGCSMLTKMKFSQSTPPNFNENEWPFMDAKDFKDKEGNARFHFYIPKGSLEDYRKAWKFTEEADKQYFVEY